MPLDLRVLPVGYSSSDAPPEVITACAEFWDGELLVAALAIAYLESGWDPFALLDTTDAEHPCNAYIRTQDGIAISAERSVGLFQINVCAPRFADWEWQRLYNCRHNAGTAHLLYVEAGNSWSPWYFSAHRLGLLD